MAQEDGRSRKSGRSIRSRPTTAISLDLPLGTRDPRSVHGRDCEYGHRAGKLPVGVEMASTTLSRADGSGQPPVPPSRFVPVDGDAAAVEAMDVEIRHLLPSAAVNPARLVTFGQGPANVGRDATTGRPLGHTTGNRSST